MDALCDAHARTDGTELEIRFGTRGPPLDKQAFDRIVSRVKAAGGASAPAQYLLRIQSEYVDSKTGDTRLSNVRVTIAGLLAIQEYCRSDKLPLVGDRPSHSVMFELKGRMPSSAGSVLDLDEWGARVSLQREETLPWSDGRVKQAITDWGRSKKVYRLIKRYSFALEPSARLDMSVVRSSARTHKGSLVATYTFAEASITARPEAYEAEVEIGASTDAVVCAAALRRSTKTILAAIQDSNYPIPRSEQAAVAQDYGNLVGARSLQPRSFIGPSSVSLERANVLESADAATSVLAGYAVTDKADGARKLLLVAKNGKLYMIDTNMGVQFTGLATSTAWAGTLLDGEHITEDKFGAFYGGYGCFDAYFVKGVDVRGEPLVTEDKKGGRLQRATQAISGMAAKPVVAGAEPLKLFRKAFYTGENVFESCGTILQREAGGLFPYATDGLMLTPMALPVGADRPGQPSPNVKKTWTKSFKWKPASHNTVDFMVTAKKAPGGGDLVSSLFVDGAALDSDDAITQYKTYILRVGYSEARHGHANPCQTIVDGPPRKREAASAYKPVPFYPSDPPDPKASVCKIALDGILGAPLTEDGASAIDDNSIVEFRYDGEREEGWRWVPIRVRHDKTAELRAGGKNFGNAYHVANSVWSTIHYPVTREMLMTGRDIPSVTDSVYYKGGQTTCGSRAMRDFHNICVKRRLLGAVVARGGSVLDLGVGKAGDLHKWIALKAGLVVGVDSCLDCIVNPFDGACARYLNATTAYKTVPPMFFLYGEAERALRGGDALLTPLGKRTMRALLGEGPDDPKVIGAGVAREYGAARDGFSVVSAQFALHYFFKDAQTFDGLIANVVDLCAPGGYFVGSCFDGRRVFAALEGKDKLVVRDGVSSCSIVREYERTVFSDDETCLGYAIDVRQDSIGSLQREYLVSFQYLESRLLDKGFEVLSAADAARKGLAGSITPFADLFAQEYARSVARDGKKTDLGQAMSMTEGQKTISFLNSCFVFRRKGTAVSVAPT